MIPHYTGFQLDLMADLFTQSAIAAKSEPDIATSWAEGFAFLDAASSADILVPTTADDNSPALTAVPKAPVFLLCVADFLYGILGLVFFIVAIRSSRDFQEMQYKMSVSSLVAQAFGE